MSVTITDAPAAPAPSTLTSGVAPRLAARLAGIGYVLIFGLAIFANFMVREGLVVAGDAAATAANISGSPGLFRQASPRSSWSSSSTSSSRGHCTWCSAR